MRFEDHGPGHPFRPADRSDQVREGERVQRLEQPHGHIDGRSLCGDMRYHRERDTCLHG